MVKNTHANPVRNATLRDEVKPLHSAIMEGRAIMDLKFESSSVDREARRLRKCRGHQNDLTESKYMLCE